MGAEVRFRAGLRAILSYAWISVASLALAVAAHVAAGKPTPLLMLVALVGSIVGLIVCRARARGKGVVVGLISIGISLYAGLVVFFLLTSVIMIA